MSVEKSALRRLWRPPRRLVDREGERRVTFLELFYDLVYVVVIAQVAHHLAGHVSVRGVLEYGFLFGLIWLAWVNGTLYHDLHGNNDVRTRVFTFVQMGTVAGMAVFAHSAFGSGGMGFALSFAAYQATLTWLWLMTGVTDPLHRPLALPYCLAFLASTLLFAGSAFAPETARVAMWVVGIGLTFLAPLTSAVMANRSPEVREEFERSFDLSESMVERFGLFTIIVLGEVIVGVVQGVAGSHHLTWGIGLAAGLGMAIAIALWWVYFDFVSQRAPRTGFLPVMTWLYMHLGLSAGIAAAGAATLNVIEAGDHAMNPVVGWVLVGSVGLVLVCIAGIIATLRKPAEHAALYRNGAITLLVATAVVAILGVVGLGAHALLGAVVTALLLPVGYGLWVWVRVFGGHEITLEAS